MIINRIYRGADKSLARPGRKQATATDFDVHIRGAGKSLARPTSQCILYDGENISFDTSLVIFIYIYIYIILIFFQLWL